MGRRPDRAGTVCSGGEALETALLATYFVLWSAAHSMLASKRFKTAVRRNVSGSVFLWYRLFFVLTAVVSFSPVVWIVLRSPGPILYATPPGWRWLMRTLQGASALFCIRAVLISSPIEFLGLDVIIRSRHSRPTRLRTTGLYGLVRHPMYLFTLLACAFFPTMTVNLLVMIGIMALYFMIGSIHEERLLIDQFGDEYLTYRQGVPRLIPVLRRKRSADSSAGI